MTDEVTVRRVRREDAPALAAIAWSIVTAYGLSHDPDLLQYGQPRLGVYAELCAELDGAPVGTITLSQHPHDRSAGWVSKFFVDPLARGRRVGKALHAALLVEAHRAGMTWLELSTLTVFHEAIALYEAHGWKRRRNARGIERRYWLRLVE